MKDERTLDEIVRDFLKKNYDYVWLKTMLEKGRRMSGDRAVTLITGSSHALFQIMQKKSV